MVARKRQACWFIGLASPLVFYALIRLLPNGLTASDSAVLAREIALLGLPSLWLIYLANRGPLSRASLGLRRLRWGDVGWGLGAAVTSIILAVATAMTLARSGVRIDSGIVGGSLLNRPTCLIVTIAIGAAISEEIVFRATMIPAITAASGSSAVAIILSSAAFALLHLSYGIGKLPVTFVTALVLAVLFVRRRSLGSCVIAHLAVDLVGLAGVLARSHA